MYIVIHLDIVPHVCSHTYCFSRNERKALQDHAQALFSFLHNFFIFTPATSGKLYKTTRKPFFFPRVEPMGTGDVGKGGRGGGGAGKLVSVEAGGGGEGTAQVCS